MKKKISNNEKLIYLERDRAMYRDKPLMCYLIAKQIKRLEKKIEKEWLKDIKSFKKRR